MLRKTIPAAIALLVMPVAAHAADISAPAGYDWTGFYIGAHGGGLPEQVLARDGLESIGGNAGELRSESTGVLFPFLTETRRGADDLEPLCGDAEAFAQPPEQQPDLGGTIYNFPRRKLTHISIGEVWRPTGDAADRTKSA